jgi:hypothetical protein
MSSPIEKAVCHACYAMIDVEDRFCRHCGAITHAGCAAGVAPPAAQPPPADDKSGWKGNRWGVLAVVFLALGPLGLPLLWRSRDFDHRAKLLLTVLLLVLTVLGLWGGYRAITAALDSLKQLQLLGR